MFRLRGWDYKESTVRRMPLIGLTGQSLLRAERNSNKCNWSTARKKIGPVNRPCDRPIDVFSIASLMFWVTSRLADQRKKIAFTQRTRQTHFGWDWFSEDYGNDK